MSEFHLHHLTKLAWSMAALPCPQRRCHPVLTTILAWVDRRLPHMNAPGAHSLLWSFWASGHPTPLGSLFTGWLRRGVDLSDLSNAMDVLLLEAEWRRDSEERLWLSLLSASNRDCLQFVLGKWAAGAVVPSWVCLDAAPWDLRRVGRNKPELAKYLPHFAGLSKWMQPNSGNHWDKLSALVEFIDRRLPWDAELAPAGRAAALVGLLEAFARSREHWLKVAGGAKAELLEHAFGRRDWRPFEVALECGTFVGYSAARLAALSSVAAGGGGGPAAAPAARAVATIEVDPVHACIARHFLDLAGASALVEVSIGQVKDVLPRLVETFGARSLGLVFMDHKGTIFHADLQLTERLGLLAPRALVLADNVALPGAPLLLWHLAFGAQWRLTTWAMMEFLEPNTEDWMALGEYAGPGPCGARAAPGGAGGGAPPSPASWRRLSWHTDHMRRRAGGLRPAEGDMFEEDRVAYARHVRRHYLAAGIEATPWTGAAQGDD